MSTHKNIDKICVAAVIVALIVCIILMNGKAFGIQEASKIMGYESRLFDISKVHTIDIYMDEWDSFTETCENEEYSVCTVIIDGEVFKNVGIRAKGNTSLTSVKSMNSERYSFKIEFDHYDSTKTYYGLDKISLNNIIQDNTFMKDYLVYQSMADFGVDAPLCSYGYITVNGDDWGLYLAVEAIEESFLQRNYGNDHGELYKPDSMSFGGGRGNGKEFDADNFKFPNVPDMPGKPYERGQHFEKDTGMDSSDVKLQYIDDDPDNYNNIFDNAKTDITTADKNRLINSLKLLGEGEEIEKIVDVDEVIRYFVVHNYVCNGDSYTGSMIHNYYLYEENGQLSMIPWDYNLAFGTFQASDVTDTVNEPIDSPVTGGDTKDRPMIAWILENEEYKEIYHQYFAEFLENSNLSEIINKTAQLIAPYVEKDPSKFCTYEEFMKGTEALAKFCELRSESIKGQLTGEIPSTTEEQETDNTALIDASGLTITDMGTMDNMNGGKHKTGKHKTIEKPLQK